MNFEQFEAALCLVATERIEYNELKGKRHHDGTKPVWYNVVLNHRNTTYGKRFLMSMKNKSPALHLALRVRQSTTARYLIESNADVLQPDEDGQSCLTSALTGDCGIEVFRKLFKHGAYWTIPFNESLQPVFSFPKLWSRPEIPIRDLILAQGVSLVEILYTRLDVHVIKPLSAIIISFLLLNP